MRHHLLVVLLCLSCFWGSPPAAHAASTAPLGIRAYRLLNQRVSANQARFYVYQDQDSGFNHGFPSGFFGTIDAISLRTGCVDAPTAADGCSTDPNALDRQRGTVMQVSFAALSSGQFAGLNIEEPQDWGVTHAGTGYDLRNATNLVFDVRSPDGTQVQFGAGGCTTAYMTIGSDWQTLTIPLSSFSCPPDVDLSNVHILFAVATDNMHDPNGVTVLLDNIRFTPVPMRQSTDPKALSLPLSTQTFGVVPQANPPFPPDQVNRNVASVYESSLTLLALLQRRTPGDVANAREIADALDYALTHDNHGDPLPPAADGSVGLHNAYESGDIALLNDQVPPVGQGKAGDARLAGFSATFCTPSDFCLVLDGATGGNNAFAVLALAEAYQHFHDSRYLNDARTIGTWVVGNLSDTTGLGYGGYYLGYPDMGKAKVLQTGKSTENNADIFAAFSRLAQIEASLGAQAEATQWTNAANVAGDFVMQMFDAPNGRFNAGTVPVGTAPSPGVCPTGAQHGNDLINTCDFLDANTFTTLALAGSTRYGQQIDWRQPITYVFNHFASSVTAAGQPFNGFDLVPAPISGPNGVAWEFTAQVVVTLRYVDQLYAQTTFEATANAYLEEIRHAQKAAPFGDRLGLVASTLDGGDTLPPLQQCLATPFQCIAERVGLAATTWAIFAAHQINPLQFPPAAP